MESPLSKINIDNFPNEITQMILEKLEEKAHILSASLVNRKFNILLEKKKKQINDRETLETLVYVPFYIPALYRDQLKIEENKKYQSQNMSFFF